MTAVLFSKRVAAAVAGLLVFAGAQFAVAPAAATLEEEEYLMRIVARLAQPSYEGRQSGSLGGKLAARYLAAEMSRLGVFPLGCGEPGKPEDYISSFTYSYRCDNRRKRRGVGRNLLGWIPGKRAQPLDGYYLLSAHYDHLGYRLTREGWKYFPGANDDASGVAAVLAVARRLTLLGGKPRYPIVIALFDAEERGLKGSQALVEKPPLPLGNAFNINFDMVGTLARHRLLVASAAEKRCAGDGARLFWNELQTVAADVPQPLELERMEEGWQAGDHYSFYRARVPFLYFFTGATAEYDRMTDTPDRLDYIGISEIANFVVQLLEQLGPPTQFRWRQLEKKESLRLGDRRAYLGTIPDFTRKVEGGVALAGVQPGSPAEAAGIRPGDIIRRIDNEPVADLKAYAELLKRLRPGLKISVVVERDGKLVEIELEVGERPQQ